MIIIVVIIMIIMIMIMIIINISSPSLVQLQKNIPPGMHIDPSPVELLHPPEENATTFCWISPPQRRFSFYLFLIFNLVTFS